MEEEEEQWNIRQLWHSSLCGVHHALKMIALEIMQYVFFCSNIFNMFINVLRIF